MPKFYFKYLDEEDAIYAGDIEVENRASALETLCLQYTLIELVEEKEPFTLFKEPIKTQDIMIFTKQLSTMLKAGMSLVKSIDIMAHDAKNITLKKMLQSTSKGIAQGKPLSDLLKDYPREFSKLFVSLVAAGEASGQLPLILQRLAVHLENAENIKKKIKAAMSYPVTILIVAFAMCFFIFLFGTKQFSEIYAGLNADLPPLTVMFMSAADFISKYWYVLIIIIAGIFYGVLYFLRTEKGAYLFDATILKIPLVGVMLKQIAITNFCRTLGTLYSSGVPIVQSLELICASIDNRVVEKVVLSALKNVKEGESISKPLRESDIFTSMSISMIASGEESGTLEIMLEEIASYYEGEVDVMIKAMMGMMEPLVILVVGVFVAVLIFALAFPLFNLIQTMG
ncbi:MAG: type II secretion system F family protein [Candidatus Eremiobacteraeota bacterium]|nr:type II secretion system F family protein [Candidatus Eremiobacteraeota bacterium]